MNKKNIIIGIIVLILLIIPIGVFASKRTSIFIPLEEKKENESTYIQNAEYTPSKEELEWEAEMKKSSDEEYDKQEKVFEIMCKYNPNEFEKIYNEIRKKNQAQTTRRKMEDIDEKAYTMMMDTYDNEKVTQEEKQIIKEVLIGEETFIREIPSLETRFNKIINE